MFHRGAREALLRHRDGWQGQKETVGAAHEKRDAWIVRSGSLVSDLMQRLVERTQFHKDFACHLHIREVSETFDTIPCRRGGHVRKLGRPHGHPRLDLTIIEELHVLGNVRHQARRDPVQPDKADLDPLLRMNVAAVESAKVGESPVQFTPVHARPRRSSLIRPSPPTRSRTTREPRSATVAWPLDPRMVP